MSRVLMPLTMLLLFVTASVTSRPARATASLAGTVVHGPVFRYILKKDRNPSVCKPMLRVFNDKFARLWDAPEEPWQKGDESYSAQSKYAFPLLPGVKHSTKATFEMRFSAWPTSLEFSAIHWKEGRAVLGGCPAGKVCSGEGLVPILIAYFDFDNDGSVDTVIRWAFNSNEYSTSDIIDVWRGQVLKISGAPNLWDLEHPQNEKMTPIMLRGEYLRPFIYQGITYVATKKANFKSKPGKVYEPSPNPVYPLHDDMLIDRYRFADRKDRIGRPEWSSDPVCDLLMQRLQN